MRYNFFCSTFLNDPNILHGLLRKFCFFWTLHPFVQSFLTPKKLLCTYSSVSVDGYIFYSRRGFFFRWWVVSRFYCVCNWIHSIEGGLMNWSPCHFSELTTFSMTESGSSKVWVVFKLRQMMPLELIISPSILFDFCSLEFFLFSR